MTVEEKLNDKNFSFDTIGKSDSQILLFEDAVLKIQNNDFNAQNELQTLLWLENQNEIISPKVFDSKIIDNKLFILMSKIQNEISENKNDFSMACDEYFLTNEALKPKRPKGRPRKPVDPNEALKPKRPKGRPRRETSVAQGV